MDNIKKQNCGWMFFRKNFVGKITRSIRIWNMSLMRIILFKKEINMYF